MVYPSDIGIVVIGVMWTLTFISACFVAARLYTRIAILKLPGADDYAAVVAWAMLLIYAAFLTEATMHGLGARGTNADPNTFGEMYKAVGIGQAFSYIGVAASKASVALFLLRIVVKTWHRVVLWIIIIVISVICLLSSVFHFARCNPVEACWDVTVSGTFLFDPVAFTAFLFAGSIVSVVCDVALVILPWTILYGLQMPKAEKRLIGTALSFGILAAIAGSVRSVTIIETKTSDLSVLMYIIVRPVLWCATELCITICASCVPILRPLWRVLRGQASSQSYGTSRLTPPHANAYGTAHSRGIELAHKAHPGPTTASYPSKQTASSMTALDDGRLSDESILLQSRATAGPMNNRLSHCGTSMDSMGTDIENLAR